MIILIDSGKAFDKTQYPLMIKKKKTLSKPGIKNPQSDKIYLWKPITNITTNGEKTEYFFSKVINKTRLSSHNFYSILDGKT